MAGTLLNSTTFNKTNANDQLNATLNQDGLLMRMAKTKGQQAAGSRGLMNSSIGSEASMRAMVDAATPIAQQNTQFAQTKDVNQQQADLTAQRDKAQADLTAQRDKTQQEYQQSNMTLESDLTGKRDATLQGYTQANTQQQADLTAQRDKLLYQQQLGTITAEGEQQLKQMNAQFGYNTQLNNQQNQFTTQRDSTLFGYDQQNKALDFQNQLQTMDKQQQLDLQKLNAQTAASKELAEQQQQYALTNMAKQVAANTQGMYLDAINGLTSTFGDQVATIQASALSAKDKTNAINSLINSQNAMLKFYQSTYQNMSTIKDDWINVDVQTLPSGTIANVR